MKGGLVVGLLDVGFCVVGDVLGLPGATVGLADVGGKGSGLSEMGDLEGPDIVGIENVGLLVVGFAVVGLALGFPGDTVGFRVVGPLVDGLTVNVGLTRVGMAVVGLLLVGLVVIGLRLGLEA